MDTNQKALQNDKPPIESLSIQKKQSQYVDQNLDNSFTRTGFSTRSDNNLDIPIIPPRDQDGFYSTHAIENYDECLMSVKNMENNIDGFFSSNAHEPEVGKYGAMDNNFVTFFSSQHGGLLVSTLFAELGSTCIKRVLLPLLQMELELEPYQVEAANTLILLPWSYTFVWGFLSDAVPLLGTRRKSYIIAGWVVSLLTNFAMAILNYTLEYNAVSRHAKTEETLKSHVAIINGYIGLLMLASFGGVLALVIAETYVVVQTRREPLKERGKALGTLLMTQFLGKLVGQIVSDKIIFHITKLGLTPIVSFRQTALFCMFCSLVPLFALVFFFHEDPDPPAINDEGTNCRPTESHEFISVESVATSCFQGLQLNWFRLRRALAKESTVDVIRFFMGFVFLSEFKLTYPHDQLELWCNFTEKAQSLSNIILGVLYILAVAVWKYYALSCNWRYGIWFSLLIIVMLPQVIFFYMAILSTSMRSQQAFMFMTALRGFLRGGLVILEAVLSAEIAPVGGEGAFLGIIISMGSIMRLLSTTFSNALAFMFEDPTIVATDQIRDQVAFGLGVCYFVKLISVVAVFSLPRQKQELQKLHRHGDTGDKSTTWWVLGSLGCAFFISAVFNLLAIIPSTTCFELFGGGGCS